MNDEATIVEIRRLEDTRCRALNEQDHAGLGDLIDDDLVHVHTTGIVEDKAAYLAGVRDRLEFRDVEREDLTVRAYGDVAVATGRLHQTVRVRATQREMNMKIMTTQVWVRRDGAWRQTSFHATNLP
jgi:ketosteroid isomerase-like protein